jgi:hypothetical protein
MYSPERGVQYVGTRIPSVLRTWDLEPATFEGMARVPTGRIGQMPYAQKRQDSQTVGTGVSEFTGGRYGGG